MCERTIEVVSILLMFLKTYKTVVPVIKCIALQSLFLSDNNTGP